MMRNFFFDYIYYRIYKFYFRWDGENGITALIGVSMIQCLILFNFLLVGERLFYTKSQVALNGDSSIVAYIAVFFFIALLLYNGFKYRNKYNGFRDRWIDESQYNRRVKGILVLITLITPWLILFIIAEF